MSTVRIKAPARLEGAIEIPSDKSISHRSLIFNAIAQGQAHVQNLLLSADVRSTIRCLQGFGVEISLEEQSEAAGQATVNGTGLWGLKEPENVLDCGNSGTTIRLLSGLAAGQPFLTVFTGDKSLRSRPMGRVIDPLRLMGARIIARDGGRYAPVAINGGGLIGVFYELPVASAQVKSAILIAGLFGQGETAIAGLFKSRDHTERMLAAMGAHINVEPGGIMITGGQPLKAADITVPGDISSAAFWLVAGAIHPNARLAVRNVGLNPTRTGIIDVLKEMGAKIRIENEREVSGEPVGDITVESSHLTGTLIEGDMIPRLIDEIPALAVAASQAKGETVIRNAEELRVKESDRIGLVRRELSALGAKIDELPDGMIIHGPTILRGAEVDSHGDHRLAMALAVAGLAADGPTTVLNSESVDISYPNFWGRLERLTQA